MDERRRAAWIGGSVVVKGNIVSAGDLMIDGIVEGTIEVGDYNLTIGQGARVDADLVAKTITIAGKVKGNVIGSTKVELKAAATVEGDVAAPKFVMEEGATIQGKVDTGRRS